VSLEKNRPRIVCHMTMSVDGRQVVDRWTPSADGVGVRQLVGHHYDEVAARFGADGWIVGRVTMEEFTEGTGSLTPQQAADGAALRTAHHGARDGRSVAVAIDPTGKLHYGQDHAAGDHVIAVLGEQVPDAYLAELRRDGVSYLFAGPDGRDLAGALDTLGADFRLRTLLLEGGGRINGAFLKAGLIDEISILVYPGIDGLAGVSSIFEYVGAQDERPAAGQLLRLIGVETLEGGMVWLRYQVEHRRRPVTAD
jgi:riboflavin biosynthesis pyrimidine reductase